MDTALGVRYSHSYFAYSLFGARLYINKKRQGGKYATALMIHRAGNEDQIKNIERRRQAWML
jgi:hypothetical protein